MTAGVTILPTLYACFVLRDGLQVGQFLYRDNAEVAVDNQPVACFDNLNGLGDACHAWDAVFAGDDGTVNQHPAAALDDRGRQGYSEGHVWIDGVAYENLTRPDLEKIRMQDNHPGRTSRNAWSCWLAADLPHSDLIGSGIFLFRRYCRTGPELRIPQCLCRFVGLEFVHCKAHSSFQSMLSFLDCSKERSFDPSQVYVIVVPQAVTGPAKIEDLHSPIAGISGKAGEKCISSLFDTRPSPGELRFVLDRIHVSPG